MANAALQGDSSSGSQCTECTLRSLFLGIRDESFNGSIANYFAIVGKRWTCSPELRPLMPDLLPRIKEAMEICNAGKASILKNQDIGEALENVGRYEIQAMAANLMTFVSDLNGYKPRKQTEQHEVPGWFPEFHIPTSVVEQAVYKGKPVPTPEAYRWQRYTERMQFLKREELCLVIKAILNLYLNDFSNFEKLELKTTEYLDEKPRSLPLATVMKLYLAECRAEALARQIQANPSRAEGASLPSLSIEESSAGADGGGLTAVIERPTEGSESQVLSAPAGAHIPPEAGPSTDMPHTGDAPGDIAASAEELFQLDGAGPADAEVWGYPVIGGELGNHLREGNAAGNGGEYLDEVGANLFARNAWNPYDGNGENVFAGQFLLGNEGDLLAGNEGNPLDQNEGNPVAGNAGNVSDEDEEEDDAEDEDEEADERPNNGDGDSDDDGDNNDGPPAGGAGGAFGAGQPEGPNREDRGPGSGGGSSSDGGSNPDMQEWANWNGVDQLARLAAAGTPCPPASAAPDSCASQSLGTAAAAGRGGMSEGSQAGQSRAMLTEEEARAILRDIMAIADNRIAAQTGGSQSSAASEAEDAVRDAVVEGKQTPTQKVSVKMDARIVKVEPQASSQCSQDDRTRDAENAVDSCNAIARQEMFERQRKELAEKVAVLVAGEEAQVIEAERRRMQIRAEANVAADEQRLMMDRMAAIEAQLRINEEELYRKQRQELDDRIRRQLAAEEETVMQQKRAVLEASLIVAFEKERRNREASMRVELETELQVKRIVLKAEIEKKRQIDDSGSAGTNGIKASLLPIEGQTLEAGGAQMVDRAMIAIGENRHQKEQRETVSKKVERPPEGERPKDDKRKSEAVIKLVGEGLPEGLAQGPVDAPLSDEQAEQCAVSARVNEEWATQTAKDMATDKPTSKWGRSNAELKKEGRQVSQDSGRAEMAFGPGWGLERKRKKRDAALPDEMEAQWQERCQEEEDVQSDLARIAAAATGLWKLKASAQEEVKEPSKWPEEPGMQEALYREREEVGGHLDLRPERRKQAETKGEVERKKSKLEAQDRKQSSAPLSQLIGKLLLLRREQGPSPQLPAPGLVQTASCETAEDTPSRLTPTSPEASTLENDALGAETGFPAPVPAPPPLAPPFYWHKPRSQQGSQNDGGKLSGPAETYTSSKKRSGAFGVSMRFELETEMQAKRIALEAEIEKKRQIDSAGNSGVEADPTPSQQPTEAQTPQLQLVERPERDTADAKRTSEGDQISADSTLQRPTNGHASGLDLRATNALRTTGTERAGNLEQVEAGQETALLEREPATGTGAPKQEAFSGLKQTEQDMSEQLHGQEPGKEAMIAAQYGEGRRWRWSAVANFAKNLEAVGAASSWLFPDSEEIEPSADGDRADRAAKRRRLGAESKLAYPDSTSLEMSYPAFAELCSWPAMDESKDAFGFLPGPGDRSVDRSGLWTPPKELPSRPGETAFGWRRTRGSKMRKETGNAARSPVGAALGAPYV